MHLYKLSLTLVLVFLVSFIKTEDEQEGRLLNNKNTATLSAAAIGLGIGAAGALLVNKVIEDRGCKDDPLGLIGDLLGKRRCKQTHLGHRFTGQYQQNVDNNYAASQFNQQNYQYNNQLNQPYPPKFSAPSVHNVYPEKHTSEYYIPTIDQQFTPTVQYSTSDQYSSSSFHSVKQTVPFSQAISYKPKPNNFHTNNGDDSVVISAYTPNQLHEESYAQPSQIYPKEIYSAIQPRNLPTLTETNLFTPVYEEGHTESSSLHEFSRGLTNKANKSGDFQETEAIVAKSDNYRNSELKSIPTEKREGKSTFSGRVEKQHVNKKLSSRVRFQPKSLDGKAEDIILHEHVDRERREKNKELKFTPLQTENEAPVPYLESSSNPADLFRPLYSEREAPVPKVI